MVQIKVKEKKIEESLKILKNFFQSEIAPQIWRNSCPENKNRKKKILPDKNKKQINLFKENEILSNLKAKSKKKIKKSRGKNEREKCYGVEIEKRREEIPKKRAVCVCVIARRLVVPYKFIIILDRNKKHGFKFPGGEPEKTDKEYKNTAQRETEEEIGFKGGLAKFKFIGEFEIDEKRESGRSNYFEIFSVDIPKEIKLSPGEEQEKIYEVYPYQIDRFIKEGIFLKNHAKAWKIYKKYIEK